MSYNLQISGQELIELCKYSAELLGRLAGQTMGPAGRPVLISGEYDAVPKATKDGHKVVSSVKPKDRSKAAIIALLAQAAATANEKAGDGTTGATILCTSMLLAAMRWVVSGGSGRAIRSGMQKACVRIVEFLRKKARTVDSKKEIQQIATVSANWSVAIGEKIAEAMEAVGKDGVISIEEGKGIDELMLKFVTGMVFDRGYLSAHFVTNQEKMTVEFDNPYILLLNKKPSMQSLIKVLEAILAAQKPLLIIAEDVESEVLGSLIFNKWKTGLKVAAVKAPGFGERRHEMLLDIAAVTGAKYVIDENGGVKTEDLSLDDLGRARRVVVTKDSTTVIDGQGSKDDIAQREKVIRGAMEDANTSYDKEKLQERLARLIGGVAVIRVGGTTEFAMKEMKDRIEDALHATRAAVMEGIVPGGGVTLLYARAALDDIVCDSDDEAIGVKIVKEALSAPIACIVANAGESSDIVINELSRRNNHDLVFDAKADASLGDSRYVDAFEAGIIDPVKVIRIGVETAISILTVLVMVESFIVDMPDENQADKMSGGGMGGGMGGMGGMGF